MGIKFGEIASKWLKRLYKFHYFVVHSYLYIHMWITNSLKWKSFDLKVVFRPPPTYEYVNSAVGKSIAVVVQRRNSVVGHVLGKFSAPCLVSSIKLASGFEVFFSSECLLS